MSTIARTLAALGGATLAATLTTSRLDSAGGVDVVTYHYDAARTGQNLGGFEAGGFSARALLPWLIGLGVLAFIIYRMRRTGQRVDLRLTRNWRILAAAAAIVVAYAAAAWAVARYRQAHR